MTQAELLEMHVKALFLMDGNGRLASINEPWDGAKPAPLLYVGRALNAEPVLYTRYDVGDELFREAEDLMRRGARGPEAFAALFNAPRVSEELCYWVPLRQQTCEECVLLTVGNLSAYDLCTFDWLAEEIGAAQPCCAFLDGKRIASVCRSVRISTAHEAGIETAAPYRGSGCAGKVLAAWSAEVYKLGKIPLYSTSKANYSSQRVADKFGLPRFATGFSISGRP